ncbi:MAG: hydrogen peroxide-inducible genes activator [Bdellovibrio sp.]|nr:hydrogen peroxide-inducible genes activator [Bdellovibrio sp.]
MKNITITQLKYVLAVEEKRNFAEAAKLCGISQPTLSMMIKKLEEELGVILFDRSKSPTIVTSDGEKTILRARKIFSELSGLEEDLHYAKELNGEIRLGIIPTLAPYLLPLFYDHFHKKHPKAHLKVLELQTDHLIGQLKRDQLDIGILATPLHDTELVEQALFCERFFIFSHAPKMKAKLNWNDIPSESLYLLSEGHCFRHQTLQICKLKRIDNISFQGGQFETLLQLIKRHRGVTLIPELLYHQLSETERNKYVSEFSPPIPTREISLVAARFFLHERKMSSLAESILANVPTELQSHKRSSYKIIPIA